MKLLEEYNFNLPPELIAQSPPLLRGESNLMVVHGNKRKIVPFQEILNYIPPKTLFVFNEVKVTPARLLGEKLETGGKIEVLILDFAPLSEKQPSYNLTCLVKPGRHFKAETNLLFKNAESNVILKAKVLKVLENGQRLIKFYFEGEPLKVLGVLGHMPLPPYIKRPDNEDDKKRYQTVYAQTEGAIAAPTAGLHFTESILNDILEQGHEIEKVLLKVGLGTFAPLTEEQLAKGKLHSEYALVNQETVLKIEKAKGENRKVLVVGTTTARALEWAAFEGKLKAAAGYTNIFIKPPYKFKVADILLTNFHLPSSSLLMMVASFMGYHALMATYKEAVNKKMKFFSYGDAMLVY